MKLFDATLDLASFAKGTEDYTISSVNGNMVVCNDLSGRVAEFGGGTIWFRTGALAGKFCRIKEGAAQTLTLPDNISGYAAGDEITIGAWLEFDTQKLVNAINSVLRTYKIMKSDESLVFHRDQTIYELPENVTEDIRRVFINVAWTRQPAVSHYWRAEDGNLLILAPEKYEDGSPIKIYYVTQHGAVGPDDEINRQVDPLYLRYMSWLYLCRNLIQNTHKDNLIASDMYNEAKVYERDYSHLPNKALGIRSFTFPNW